VDLLSEISVLRVGGNEGDKHDNTSHVEELGDFGDAADVLGAVLSGEAETLVETHADNVTIKDEGLGNIAAVLVNLLLEGFRKGRLAGTRETSEPVGGTRGRHVSGIVVYEGLGALTNDLLLFHVVKDEVGGLVEGLLTSVDVELAVSGSLVGVRNTSEGGNDTSTSLLVKSLNVTAFANLEGSGDVAFEELKTSCLVEVFGEVTVLGVGGNESDEHDNTSHVKELGDFGDTSDVLGAVLSGEAETLVEASADNVSIEDENLGGVTNLDVKVLLEGLG
jgi:hypothetical protein